MTIDENTFKNMFGNLSEIEKTAKDYARQMEASTVT